jgi:hypothetical protein
MWGESNFITLHPTTEIKINAAWTLGRNKLDLNYKDKFDSLKMCGISLALVHNIYQDRLFLLCLNFGINLIFLTACES